MAWAVVPTLALGTDLPTGFTAGDTSRARNRVVLSGGFLGPCVAGAVTDEGTAVTAAAGPGQAQLPSWWGRGQGNWGALDVDRVDAIVQDSSDDASYACANAGQVEWASITQAAGDLTFTFRNRGAGAGPGVGPLRISFIYWQSFNR